MKTLLFSLASAALLFGCSNPQINYTVVPYAVIMSNDNSGGDLTADQPAGGKCPQPNERAQAVYSGPAISLAFTVDNTESFNCITAVLTVDGREEKVVVAEQTHSGIHRFNNVTSMHMRMTETPANLVEGQALATGNVEVWF